MKIKNLILIFFLLAGTLSINSEPVSIQKSSLVGDRIVEFIPAGFDQTKTPSLILKEEPVSIGTVPAGWSLIPEFTLVSDKASASLKLTGEVSLYGGGEVTGPLLRNGQYIKLWNTDTGAYGIDGGKRLYQSHPWVMGVREDGTAFGILFDTSWKSELYTNSDEIILNTEGALFRAYIIDRESPRSVLKGLAELTGTIQMPALWTLGYHQCRFSYSPDSKVREIANTFRAKNIPCDVIWMDIDYMDGYRIFTFSPAAFPNPKALNDELHGKGFHTVYMIDPGVKVENGYSIYDSGTQNDIWVKRPNGQVYQGKVWPGYCAFPDFTIPKARTWWAGLYRDFLAKGIDGVWNDMNEPAVNDDDLTENQRIGTMPYNTPHRGGGNLPAGTHLLYHNAYGRLMVEASYNGILAANPDKRPFLLTRANLLGGQRYAATWTGDNYAAWDQLKLSVPMSITLGLSGQPFNGPDIGGFLGDTSGDLWATWLGFGVFMPFTRGHACAGTNNKEPWAFGKTIEKTSRIAIERRYRLLPYLYTLFYEASQTGMPVMQPVFFADPQDLRLRSEQQVFLLGEDMLVIPAFAENPTLPSGIWEDLSLVDGDMTDIYQAKLRVKGGSIIPAGKIIQNTNENMFDPLTLIVCLDEDGKAEGKLYTDAGDGWTFKSGDYGLLTFKAERSGNIVKIKSDGKEGERNVEQEISRIDAQVLFEGRTYKGTGSLTDGVEVVINIPQLISTLEAENGIITLPAKIKYVDGYSGNAYVGDNDFGSSILFNDVEIPEEGTYEFKTYYTSMQLRSIAVKTNNNEEVISTIINTTPEWNVPPIATMSAYIYLNQGKNTIKITPYPSNQGGPNLDKFEIYQTNETIPRPEVEKLSFISDHTDEAEITAQYANETLPYLTDNDEYTFYKVAGVTSTQITAKCKYPVLLTGYLFSAGIKSSEDLTKWVLESSKDGNSWTVVNPNKSTDLSGASLFEINRTYGAASADRAQYYRLTAKGTPDVEVAEWQLFGVPYIDNTDGKSFPQDITEGIDIQEKALAHPEGASGSGWSEKFYNLFNRELNRKYYISGSKQYYVEIELDKVYQLDSYTLTSADGYPDRDPKKWTFNGYNDVLGWVELDRQTDFHFPCRYATMRFDIDNSAGFSKFLLDVEDNNGSSDSQLLKWQMFGKQFVETGIKNFAGNDCSVWQAQGKINILLRKNILLSYNIFNTSGILVTKGAFSAAKQEIPVPKGIYVVMLSDGVKSYNTKVIVL